jgi:hypothetical protein
VHYVEIIRQGNKPDEFSIKGLDISEEFSSNGDIHWRGSFPGDRVAGNDLRLGFDGGLVLMDSLNKVVGRFS